MGYEQLPALKLIVQSLLSTFPNVNVKNVDTSYTDVMELFSSLQFKEVTRQFEMSKKLGLELPLNLN